MKVTVCELGNTLTEIEKDWITLVDHVRSEASNLVLLPEMPFFPWVAATDKFDPKIWQASISAHDRWIERLADLGSTLVVGSRPIKKGNLRLNEGFVWDARSGYRPVHHKYYLPDEDGYWEATWYHRGTKKFNIIETKQVRIGFLICTEIWFNAHARDYSKLGIELLVCPRATPEVSADKWITGGRTAAIVSGAYCLSSNLAGQTKPGQRLWG